MSSRFCALDLLRRGLVAAALFVAVPVAAAPAAAQYGGSCSLLVDPVRVEIDGEFDVVGWDTDNPPVIEITIDGFPGVLATAVPGAGGVYEIDDIEMPPGVVAGQSYTVRATCGSGSVTFLIDAVCNDGDDPDDLDDDGDEECGFGNTVGGEPDPDTTTTTTEPAGTTGGGGSSTSSPNLAVTGTDTLMASAMIGSTLVAAGFALVLLAGRRRDRAPAV